jgi:hypothetical protein
MFSTGARLADGKIFLYRRLAATHPAVVVLMVAGAPEIKSLLLLFL